MAAKGKTPAQKGPAKPKPTTKSASRFRLRGVLFTISCLLITSAVLRVGEHAGAVFAREEAPDDLAAIATDQESQSCDIPDDIAAVIAAINARQGRLDTLEAELMDREAALSLVESEVTEKLAGLAAAEEALQATMARAETALEDDLSGLTSVYENMKPAEAAPLFEAMDPRFAAGFMSRMRSDAAGDIMGRLTPATANTISILMASRNANAPTE